MSQALKLHEKLKTQVRTERKITHEILRTLQEFDITQSYRELGYSSLYNYLVQSHGYSEGAANRRIQASRLLKQCPHAAIKIEEGKLNLSQLALAQSAIKQEEKKSSIKITNEQKQKTLEGLEGKNHFETQKILVETFPQFEISKHKTIPTKNKTVQVQLEFSAQDWNKIQSLLAHMSHKVPDQKLETALLYWANQIEKQKLKVAHTKSHASASNESASGNCAEPSSTLKASTSSATRTETIPTYSTKASTHSATQADSNPPSSTKTAATDSSNLTPKRRWKSRRRYISVKVKNLVFKKAEHRCEYRSPLTGERCASSYFLDIDHIKPLALGGLNDQSNLRALCRSHNHLMAKQMHLLWPHS